MNAITIPRDNDENKRNNNLVKKKKKHLIIESFDPPSIHLFAGRRLGHSLLNASRKGEPEDPRRVLIIIVAKTKGVHLAGV